MTGRAAPIGVPNGVSGAQRRGHTGRRQRKKVNKRRGSISRRGIGRRSDRTMWEKFDGRRSGRAMVDDGDGVGSVVKGDRRVGGLVEAEAATAGLAE